MTPESRTHASPLSSSEGSTCMTGPQAPISQSAQALLARPVSNPFSVHRADSTVAANTCSWNHPPVRDGGKTHHRTLAVHPRIVGHDLLLNAEKSCRNSIVSREEKRGRLLDIDHGNAGNPLPGECHPILRDTGLLDVHVGPDPLREGLELLLGNGDEHPIHARQVVLVGLDSVRAAPRCIGPSVAVD